MDTRNELIELITCLVAVPATEDDEQAVIARITALSPDPAWSDYIFYTKEFIRSDGSVEVERIVDKLLLPTNSSVVLKA